MEDTRCIFVMIWGLKLKLIPHVGVLVEFAGVSCISCAGERPLEGCKNQQVSKMASCCGFGGQYVLSAHT